MVNTHGKYVNIIHTKSAGRVIDNEDKTCNISCRHFIFGFVCN